MSKILYKDLYKWARLLHGNGKEITFEDARLRFPGLSNIVWKTFLISYKELFTEEKQEKRPLASDVKNENNSFQKVELFNGTFKNVSELKFGDRIKIYGNKAGSAIDGITQRKVFWDENGVIISPLPLYSNVRKIDILPVAIQALIEKEGSTPYTRNELSVKIQTLVNKDMYFNATLASGKFKDETQRELFFAFMDFCIKNNRNIGDVTEQEVHGISKNYKAERYLYVMKKSPMFQKLFLTKKNDSKYPWFPVGKICSVPAGKSSLSTSSNTSIFNDSNERIEKIPVRNIDVIDISESHLHLKNDNVISIDSSKSGDPFIPDSSINDGFPQHGDPSVTQKPTFSKQEKEFCNKKVDAVPPIKIVEPISFEDSLKELNKPQLDVKASLENTESTNVEGIEEAIHDFVEYISIPDIDLPGELENHDIPDVSLSVPDIHGDYKVIDEFGKVSLFTEQVAPVRNVTIFDPLLEDTGVVMNSKPENNEPKKEDISLSIRNFEFQGTNKLNPPLFRDLPIPDAVEPTKSQESVKNDQVIVTDKVLGTVVFKEGSSMPKIKVPNGINLEFSFNENGELECNLLTSKKEKNG